jgi:hypothetical protein
MKYRKAKAPKYLVFMFIFSLLALYPIQIVFPQTSSTTVAVKPSESTPRLGETITINITIANVQNLYALDVTLQWNTSALTVVNVNLRLGVESHSDGVLHGSRLNYDDSTLVSGDIFVEESNVSQEIGEYHLVATSIGSATNSFSGSGNIAILTFNVTSIGHSELDLTTELADYNPSGSSFIDHTDLNGSVNAVIPEFPSAAALMLFFIVATIAVLFSKKLMKKNPAQTTTLTHNS